MSSFNFSPHDGHSPQSFAQERWTDDQMQHGKARAAGKSLVTVHCISDIRRYLCRAEADTRGKPCLARQPQGAVHFRWWMHMTSVFCDTSVKSLLSVNCNLRHNPTTPITINSKLQSVCMQLGRISKEFEWTGIFTKGKTGKSEGGW